MANNDLLMKAIHQIFQNQSTPKVQNTDLAQYLLSHTYTGSPSKTISADIASKQSNSEGPSLLSKTFDLLSSGLYGTVNVANDTINAVKEANQKNEHANLGQRLLNTLGGETGDILGSVAKNTVGSLARGAGDVTDILGQVTGLDQAPIVGGAQSKLESGLTGAANKLTPRMMSSEVLDKQLGVKNPWVKYGGGFVSDVILDPTTYVPGVDIIGGIKKARAAKRLAQGFRTDEMIAKDASSALDNRAALPSEVIQGTTPGTNPVPSALIKPKFVPPASTAELAVGKSLIPSPLRDFTPPPVAGISKNPGLLQSLLDNPQGQDLADLQALRRSDNATRAANVRWGKAPDAHEIPAMGPEEKAVISEMGRQGEMAKKGIVSDGKGDISQPAVADVVKQISEGNIPRFGPQPEAATGAAADHAVQVAEERIANLDKPARKGLSNKILTPADQENLYTAIHNRAAKLVNADYEAKRAAKEAKGPAHLPAKLQNYVDQITAHAESQKRLPDPKEVDQFLKSSVVAKTLTEAQAKKIRNRLFPKVSEPIRNFAATRYGKKAVDKLALQMLKTAEDHAIAQGVKPVHWNGMGVRLSEVLADIGAPEGFGVNIQPILDAFVNKNASKITDPTVRQSVERALARRSLSMSDILGGLSNKALQVKNEVLDKYPSPVAEKILNALPKQGSEAAQSIGATSVEGRAMADHIRSIIDSNRLPEEQVLDKIGRETATKLLEGKGTQEEIMKANDAIGKMIGETPIQASKDITGSKALDGFFARMSTWKGRPEEIKKFSQDSFLYAEINASWRARLLRHITQTYTPEQIASGFRLAQQPEQLRLVSEGLVSDPQVLETANIFKNYFDWSLGSTGFTDLQDLAGTVSVKSSMVMADVNRHLKAVGSKFQFTDMQRGAFVSGETKVSRDYSRTGVGWMHSWENAKPIEYNQDPISFMYDMDLAIQRTVAEYATFDEFARRFGAQVGDAHFNPDVHKAIIPNARLAGYKFHPEVQQEMLRLIKDLETGAWSPSSPAMRNIVKATRVWKSSVTIYRPVHHIRNVIGDAYNMWLAGHNNPSAFTRAIKVLETQKPRYMEALKSNSMDNLKSLIDVQSLDTMGLLKPEIRSTEAIIKKGAVKLDSENLWSSGFKRGLFLTYNRIEDLFGQTPMGNLIGTTPERSVMRTLAAPFGGRAHDVATRVSEHREHFVRMAHYISAVEKKLPKNGKVSQQQLEKIYDEAAHEVRKYHPDGTDMTQFEQKARVLIPFYAWTRKEIPLLAQAMVERPAKIVAMPRAERALAGASGINVNEDQGMLDPYPNDQMFPDWIRASGIGPIGDPQSNSAVARFWAKFGAKTMPGPSGYVTINPSNPFQDVTTQLLGFGDPQSAMRGTLNSMNPMIQIPASLAFDRTFSGAPISSKAGGEGVTNYLLRQIPQLGEFSRLSGVKRNDNAAVVDRTKQNLINFFTGAGILGTGPYVKSAEFEAKARAKANAKSK